MLGGGGLGGGIGEGGLPDEGGGGQPAEAASGGAPVSEEVLWKARAEEAEERAAQLEAEIEGLRRELESVGQRLSEAARRHEIDRSVAASDAVDAETVALLAERELDGMEEPDVTAALAALRRAKPFLFGRRALAGSAHAGAALGPVVERARRHGDELHELAEDARESGDRRALMEYLRQRRGE